MAVPVKDAARSAAKYVARARAAGADYEAGVKAAGPRWQEGAEGGAQNFAQGVQDAIADNRFLKGVQAAGASKYVTRAGTVGARRFPEGVAAAEGDYQKGVAPFLQVIAQTDLPPRRPTGSPENYERVRVLGERLREFKLSRGG